MRERRQDSSTNARVPAWRPHRPCSLSSLMLNGRPLRITLPLALFAAAAIPVRADTSETLRLTDLFALPPAVAARGGGEAGYDPAGPVLVVPDVNLWRLPKPTPTPAPTPIPEPLPFGMRTLPAVPMIRQNAVDPLVQESKLPGLRLVGRLPDLALRGRAQIGLANTFTQLLLEARLTPLGADNRTSGDPFVTLLEPGGIETFSIPEGTWRVELLLRPLFDAEAELRPRRLGESPNADRARRPISFRYEPAEARAGTQYAIELPTESEQELEKLLDRQ